MGINFIYTLHVLKKHKFILYKFPLVIEGLSCHQFAMESTKNITVLKSKYAKIIVVYIFLLEATKNQ